MFLVHPVGREPHQRRPTTLTSVAALIAVHRSLCLRVPIYKTYPSPKTGSQELDGLLFLFLKAHRCTPVKN
ncbi:hypothetical protein CgunFtcFv8_018048 [Champsocephalus gunnari]|uniref:Uncharacterized protein n=1 Tax=Champsocephalus gunnari TaxID=52237 RepID=A0AAN8DNH7_CHAGU|nr:hypothetical protein CgunFtcFv8_018048 [Champsocephalus gunnari]